MKASYSGAFALLSAGFAMAQENFTTAGEGASPPEFSNPTAVASKSVYFDLYTNSNWTWTTNIQSASVSNSTIPNAQVLNTEYEFAWPNGGDFSDAVAAGQGQTSPNTFCVTVVESLFPSGVIRNYDTDTEDNASDGSCQNPLRKRCYDAIIEHWGESTPDASGCRGTDLDLSTIRQCEWSFDGYQAATYNLLRNETLANQTSGSGFVHISTGVYDGTNRTWADQATGRLQMIIIDSGSILSPLCTRVDADASSQQGASNSATTLGVGANYWLIATAGFVALSHLL